MYACTHRRWVDGIWVVPSWECTIKYLPYLFLNWFCWLYGCIILQINVHIHKRKQNVFIYGHVGGWVVCVHVRDTHVRDEVGEVAKAYTKMCACVRVLRGWVGGYNWQLNVRIEGRAVVKAYMKMCACVRVFREGMFFSIPLYLPLLRYCHIIS